MKTALEGNLIFMVIEYLGIFSCGLSGGLAAVRKGYDMIAILLVSWISALGGGVVRDVLLGQVPPSGITDKGSVIVTLASGLVVAVAHPEISRMTWSMLVTDAMALGSFAVNGTSKALMCETGGMTAIFMGMATALVGGLLRDIILNQVPAVIQDQHWYALPSLIGCLLTLASTRAQQHGLYPARVDMAVDLVIVALVVVLRIISVKFDILVPGAMERRSARLPLNDAQLARAIRHLMRGRSDISVTIKHDNEVASENSKGGPGFKKGR